MSLSFYIKTFGCQMNVRDSEIISQSLTQFDYVETMEIDSADLIILNTCSIRAKAEQKVMSLLGYLRKNKKRNPRLKICVAGCVAQQAGRSIIVRMPHVDLVVGTQNIYNIPSLLKDNKSTNKVAINLSDSYSIPPLMPTKIVDSIGEFVNPSPTLSKFVTIMQGCNNYCTYCVVPYTRGREVSRNVKDIIEEVSFLVKSGVKEITLLGQNVNSYGLTNTVNDKGTPYSFSELLREVAKISGVERLRFTTSNPKDLSDDLMRCFSELENLCPQFHLPVQSGSDRILKLMNRKYSIEKYLSLVKSLRNYCPEIALTTDIIVGFPGESEDDFSKTLELLEVVRFDGSFSFKYSDRPGTTSASFKDKISENIKSDRLHLFQKRQNEISLKRNNKYIGAVIKVMVEGGNSSSYKCRAVANHIVHIENDRTLSPGDIIKSRIYHAGYHSLKGKIVGTKS